MNTGVKMNLDLNAEGQAGFFVVYAAFMTTTVRWKEPFL